MLKLIHFREKYDPETQETLMLLDFQDREKVIYRMTAPNSNMKIYSLVVGFGTANKDGSDLYIKGYTVKPGTVEIDPDKPFEIQMHKRQVKLIAVPTKEKKRDYTDI